MKGMRSTEGSGNVFLPLVWDLSVEKNGRGRRDHEIEYHNRGGWNVYLLFVFFYFHLCLSLGLYVMETRMSFIGQYFTDNSRNYCSSQTQWDKRNAADHTPKDSIRLSIERVKGWESRFSVTCRNIRIIGSSLLKGRSFHSISEQRKKRGNNQRHEVKGNCLVSKG